MKLQKLLLIVLAFFGATSVAAPGNSTAEKETDISFDEILVKGKHHFNGEAVVTVEQDKVLNALLEVRKDFKDRIDRSKVQY